MELAPKFDREVELEAPRLGAPKFDELGFEAPEFNSVDAGRAGTLRFPDGLGELPDNVRLCNVLPLSCIGAKLRLEPDIGAPSEDAPLFRAGELEVSFI